MTPNWIFRTNVRDRRLRRRTSPFTRLFLFESRPSSDKNENSTNGYLITINLDSISAEFVYDRKRYAPDEYVRNDVKYPYKDTTTR